MGFLTSLGESGLANAILATAWAFPALEILHYAGIILWLGSVAMLDFRLIGWSRTVPLHDFNLGPGAWIGGLLTLVTGVLMFIALPTSYAANAVFWIKILLLIVATGLPFFFHAKHLTDSARWEHGPPPAGARIAGAVSLILWFGVLVAGRFMVYFGPTADSF